jgi:hypothetical protein
LDNTSSNTFCLGYRLPEIDFSTHFLIGYEGDTDCDSDNHETSINITKSDFNITISIEKGYCMNLVIFSKWLIVNKKHKNKKINFLKTYTSEP